MLGLNKSIEKLTSQLRGFSATARMLIASIMVILVMGLLLVAQFAGRPDMVSLGLDGALNAETRTRAISYLKTRGVRWDERDGDVFVPLEEKYAILAQLTESQLITTDQIDFDSILRDDRPFTDRRTKKTRYLVAKMNVVARMISEVKGIERATVVIDQPERPGGMGAARIEPTASVNVKTTSAPLSSAKADAIARMVAGAHASLKVSHVTVVDARTGRTVAARSDDDVAAGRHLEQKKAAEADVRQKIDDLLSYIPGVRVAVNAQVDTSEVEIHRRGVDEAKLGVTEENVRERTSTNQTTAREPGVRPNTGGVTLAAGRTSGTSDNESKTRMVPAFGTSEENIRRDRGYALKINATIRIPRSWFIRLHRHDQDDETAEPDAATLDALVADETEKIRLSVEPLIDTGAKEGAVAGTVVVSMYSDPDSERAGGERGWSGESAAMGGSLVGSSLVRTVGLATLALVSLLLMFMMVRKAGHDEELPTPEELVGMPPALAQADSDLVGEVTETAAAMEGIEIDEGDVRRQQMLDQINDLAASAPEEAAVLLRKWIKTDE